jgi:hypothetical protein
MFMGTVAHQIFSLNTCGSHTSISLFKGNVNEPGHVYVEMYRRSSHIYAYISVPNNKDATSLHWTTSGQPWTPSTMAPKPTMPPHQGGEIVRYP